MRAPTTLFCIVGRPEQHQLQTSCQGFGSWPGSTPSYMLYRTPLGARIFSLVHGNFERLAKGLALYEGTDSMALDADQGIR